MKRILLIVILTLAIAGIGTAVYFYFLAPSASLSVAPAGSITLPSAGEEGPVSTNGGEQPSGESSPPATVSARLVRISKGPVVPGEIIVDISAKNASSSPDSLVFYIEQQSGNVFSYSIQTGIVTRTNNKTLPGIRSANWLPNGAAAFVQYFSGEDFSMINTYVLPSIGGSNGFFLPQNITNLSVSSSSVLALASGVNGSVASLMRPDGSKIGEPFTTPLSSIRTSFAGKNQYLVFTKPSASLDGSVFLVNTSRQFSRIAGPLPGLVALASPSGKWLLVSSTTNGAMQLQLINISTRVNIPLPLATIADKCVWTTDETAVYCGIPIDPPADAEYPDDWYQGVLSFSDKIWRIDVAGRFAELVLDFPSETEKSLDTEALAVSLSKTALVFINKTDSSLWLYKL